MSISIDGLAISLDAMGGDHGPKVVVPAAIAVLKKVTNLKIYLVGKPEILSPLLSDVPKYILKNLQVVPATEVIAMDEKPAIALRYKRDSSMHAALGLVKKGIAHACVSAGNTGALVAIARYTLKMLPNISRPAIIRPIPSLTGDVFVLDLGANVDCSAEQLVQFAIMSNVLVSAIRNDKKPSIGLLNVGSESIKGNELVKKSAAILEKLTELNYIGYVEGDDIYHGTAKIVVCDGFTGNIVLKASEGLVNMIFYFLKKSFQQSLWAKCVAILAKPLLMNFRNFLDPDAYNGASLLGLNGVVIKSHGNAGVESFKKAILVAIEEASNNIPKLIKDKLNLQVKHAEN